MSPIVSLLNTLDAALESTDPTVAATLDTDRTFRVDVVRVETERTEAGEITTTETLRVEIEGLFPRFIVNGQSEFALTLRDRLGLFCWRRSVRRQYRRDNRAALAVLARDLAPASAPSA